MILPANIKKLFEEGKFIYTKHFYARQVDRNVRSIDVVNSILTGQVIEHIESYGRGHKFIVHNTCNNITHHIVFAFNNNILSLITIYIPNSPMYENTFLSDLKTRNKKL